MTLRNGLMKSKPASSRAPFATIDRGRPARAGVAGLGGINPAADKQNRLKPVATASPNLFQQVSSISRGFESASEGRRMPHA